MDLERRVDFNLRHLRLFGLDITQLRKIVDFYKCQTGDLGFEHIDRNCHISIPSLKNAPERPS